MAGGEERASFFQQLDDDGVGFEDGEAFVGLGLISAEALGVHVAAGVVDILGVYQVIPLARRKVVDAVGGRGVDRAGALVGGDVGGVGAEDGAVEERMLEGGAVERGAGEERDDVGLRGGLGGIFGAHEARVDDDLGEQGLGDDVDRVRRGKGDVFHLGMEGYGEGGRESPGGGGPDDGVDGFAGECGFDGGGVAGEFVADVDAGRGVLLVLDFRFGEGGAVVDAPGYGLEALVDEAVLEEVEECLGDAGLVDGVHGGVGLGPAAEDAHADELGALEVEVLLGVLAAGAADGHGVHFELFAAELLVNLDFDGEAVAVPAGDVGGVESGHGLGFDDEVLEGFIEGVAEVDGSVGVGRAVVEDVAGGAGSGTANLAVKVRAGSISPGPGGEAQGLVDGQAGLHGEGGLREIQGGFKRLWIRVAGGLRVGYFGHSFLGYGQTSIVSASARGR